MIRLLIGLGNPGDRYHFTRHNFGFLTLDFYAKVKNLTWEKSPKFGAEWLRISEDFRKTPATSVDSPISHSVAPASGAKPAPATAKTPVSSANSQTPYPKTSISDTKSPFSRPATSTAAPLFLIKPQNFYNSSGEAVQAFAHYYRIPPAEILVICDDFALEFGRLRFRARGSAGGNNGLKSVIRRLGTEDFPRLRLGTANDELRAKLGDTDFVLGKFTEEEKAELPAILRAVTAKIDELIG